MSSVASNVANNIPIIDLNKISGEYDFIRDDSKNFENLSQEFGSAMNSIGFAYIKNHGIDMNIVS